MDHLGKSVLIKDHPLGKLVSETWNEELEKRGFDKEMNVCDLPDKIYKEICKIIDEKVEHWFEGQDLSTQKNHRNAWNYQARHK